MLISIEMYLLTKWNSFILIDARYYIFLNIPSVANINKLYVIRLIFVSQKQNSPQNPKTRELHKIQIQYNRTKNYNIYN